MSSRYVWQRSNVAYTAAYSAMDVESSSYMGSGYRRTFQGVPDYTFSEWTGRGSFRTCLRCSSLVVHNERQQVQIDKSRGDRIRAL